MKSHILAAFAALSLAVFAPASADATTMNFEIDTANSSVTLTETGSNFVCFITTCGVEVALASGLGGSFSLTEGASNTFDFLTFTGDDFGRTRFDISATLAFLEPAGHSTTSDGAGRAKLFNGYILGGRLFWDDVPETTTLADGSIFTVDFQDGSGILLGHSVTTSATVTADYITPMPLPASSLLLLAALGSILGLRRRTSAA